jgi:Sigma-70 region 2
MPLGFTPPPDLSHLCSDARSEPHPDPGLDSSRTGLVSNQRAAKDRELAALMRAAQDGNKVAYVSLLRELLPLVQRIVFGKLCYLQPADRDDVVQEVLLSLHAARATYDPRRPFVPWLMAIAHHRIVDRMRRSARLSAHEVSMACRTFRISRATIPGYSRYPQPSWSARMVASGSLC